MDQTPDKRAHIVTTLIDSLVDSPEVVANVNDAIVTTVLKTLLESNKVLKHENVLRKQENLNTWNSATQTFDSVIDRVVTNTTEIGVLKRKVDELYEKGARFMLRRRRGPTHLCSHCVLPRVAQSVSSPSSMAMATNSSVRIRGARRPRWARRRTRPCSTARAEHPARPRERRHEPAGPEAQPKRSPPHPNPPSRVCGLCR